MPDMITPTGTEPYARVRNPGRIQTFGALLTAHPRTLAILNASENVAALLGRNHGDLLGKPFPELLSDAAEAALAAQSLAGDCFAPLNPMLVHIGGRSFDLVAHMNDGLVFLELEPLSPGAPTRADLDRLTDDAIMGMMAPDVLEELYSTAPAVIREATGFDRVLLYKFDDRYSGQVIGEARKATVDSYLGLFFPESDIGAPARELYTQNFCRYIPTITFDSHRVIPADNPLTGRPLDMSFCMLRSVLGCHVDYLSNMSVAASMSFSIIVNGRLWGLFACHHYSPSTLSYTQRLVCEQVAMLFAAKLSDLVKPEAIEARLADERAGLLASSPLRNGHPLKGAWDQDAEKRLLSVVNADGAALYWDGEVGMVGKCPDFTPFHSMIADKPDEFRRILYLYDQDGLFFTNSAAEHFDFGDQIKDTAAGVLIIPLSRDGKRYLFWFRPEQVVKATWAGNPGNSLVKDPNALMSPRRSFAAWKQDIRDRSEPWDTLEIQSAAQLRDDLRATAH